MDKPVEQLQYGQNIIYIGSGVTQGSYHDDYLITSLGWGYGQVGSGLDLYVGGVLGQSGGSAGTPVRMPQAQQPDPDDERIHQLAVSITNQAGWVGTGSGIGTFYAASALGALNIVAEAGWLLLQLWKPTAFPF